MKLKLTNRYTLSYLLLAILVFIITSLMLPYYLRLILGLLSALIFSWLVASFTAKSTKQINKAIQEATKGDLNQKVLISGADETSELANSLNLLFKQLQDKIEEAHKERNKVAAIVTSMTEGVIACDTESRIFLINKAIEKIFSVTATAVQGKMFIEAIRNNELDSVMVQVLRSGEPRSQEISILLPVQKIFLIQASPLAYDQRIIGAVLVLHDVTELKRLENMRKDFISNVSHEMRTPLTSIRGFIETLLAGALEDKNNNRRFLNIINDHAERLGKLINDLLTLSKIESPGISLKLEPLDLAEAIKRILESFKPQLEKTKISCSIEIKSPLSKITADPDKIRQVLINLLDNAIKFNKENGTIAVTLTKMENLIQVSIIDTGVGIPQKDLTRIFERFYRVDKARSRELGGTGLGLSIVKHIIEAHHGQVGVSSVEEKGSTFWFTLPM